MNDMEKLVEAIASDLLEVKGTLKTKVDELTKENSRLNEELNYKNKIISDQKVLLETQARESEIHINKLMSDILTKAETIEKLNKEIEDMEKVASLCMEECENKLKEEAACAGDVLKVLELIQETLGTKIESIMKENTQLAVDNERLKRELEVKTKIINDTEGAFNMIFNKK